MVPQFGSSSRSIEDTCHNQGPLTMNQKFSGGKSYLILTCEHAGNRVPRELRHLFEGKTHLLETHRGYDLGALSLASTLANEFRVPLFTSVYTRLVCDLNRSGHNPTLFSEFTRNLAQAEKEKILKTHYFPHRLEVEAAIQRYLKHEGLVIHIGVHTFTPSLDGRQRKTDVGFLYDPQRPLEKFFCLQWQRSLLDTDESMKVRRNYPYRGKADGFPNHFRRIIPETSYIGIELEVNQKFYLAGRKEWNRIKRALVESLRTTLKSRLI